MKPLYKLIGTLILAAGTGCSLTDGSGGPTAIRDMNKDNIPDIVYTAPDGYYGDGLKIRNVSIFFKDGKTDSKKLVEKLGNYLPDFIELEDINNDENIDITYGHKGEKLIGGGLRTHKKRIEYLLGDGKGNFQKQD